MAFSNVQQKMNHKVGSAKARGRHDIRAYFARTRPAESADPSADPRIAAQKSARPSV